MGDWEGSVVSRRVVAVVGPAVLESEVVSSVVAVESSVLVVESSVPVAVEVAKVSDGVSETAEVVELSKLLVVPSKILEVLAIVAMDVARCEWALEDMLRVQVQHLRAPGADCGP